MLRNSKNMALVLLIAAFAHSCVNDKADTVKPVGEVMCDTSALTYSEDIHPIIQQHCALSGCHTNATMAGGYSYENYNGLHAVIQNGRLIGAISHQPGFVAMPQNTAKLSDCDIAKITQWVATGAPNN